MAIKKTHQKLLFYISDHRVPGGESVGTKGGQTFIWKFDTKGIFTSSATVKSKIKDAMVNQKSLLTGFSQQARLDYFGIPFNNNAAIDVADIEFFINQKFNSIFK